MVKVALLEEWIRCSMPDLTCWHLRGVSRVKTTPGVSMASSAKAMLFSRPAAVNQRDYSGERKMADKPVWSWMLLFGLYGF